MMPTPPLTPADPKDLRHAVLYALRFNRQGKAHGVRMRDNAEMMASAVVAHLELSNYRVFRGPPLEAHSAPPMRPVVPGDEKG